MASQFTAEQQTKIYQTFRKAQFSLDFNENLTKETFYKHFENEKINKSIIEVIYNSIDVTLKRYISPADFFAWQRKQCTRKNINILLAKVQIPKNDINNIFQDINTLNTKQDIFAQHVNHNNVDSAIEFAMNLDLQLDLNDASDMTFIEKDISTNTAIKTKKIEQSVTEELHPDDVLQALDLFGTDDSSSDSDSDSNDGDDDNDDEEEKEIAIELIDEYDDESDPELILQPTQLKIPPSHKASTDVSGSFRNYIQAHSPKPTNSPRNNFGNNLAIGQPTHEWTASKSVSAYLEDDSDESSSESESESEDDEDNGIHNEFANEEITFTKMECICYLIFLVIFTSMSILSIGSYDINYTQTVSIRKSIVKVDQYHSWNANYDRERVKTFTEATTIQDIYIYLEECLFPFLLLNQDEDDKYLYYVQQQQILLGGMRLRQIRQKGIECNRIINPNFTLIDWFKDDRINTNKFNIHHCYDMHNINREPVFFDYNDNEFIDDYNISNITNTTYIDEPIINYTYIDSSVLNDQPYSGQYGTYPGGGYIQDFPLDYLESIRLLNFLRNITWIDGFTSFLSLDFTTYNPSHSLHTIVRLVWEMPTSGVFARADVKTYKFDRYGGSNIIGITLLFLHILFVMFVVIQTGMSIIDIFSHFKDNKMIKTEEIELIEIHKSVSNNLDNLEELKREKSKKHSLKKHKKKASGFWTKWRILEAIHLILFYCTIVLFLFNEVYEKNILNIYDPYPPFQSFRRLIGSTQFEAYILAFNGMLLWIKMFKYLTFSRRLRFLFTMFREAMQDILMFIVLLFIFYLVYGFVGFIMFSSDISEFRSFSFSIISVNKFMLTQMIYEELISSSSIFGSIYYLLWIVWMGFILINVFIAILIDSYSKTMTELELNTENQKEFNIFNKGRSYIKQLQNIQLHARMKNLDADGDGTLSPQEIADELACTLDEAVKIVKKYDKDGDGVLDEKEFQKLKQKIIRIRMNEKPTYRNIENYKHDNINKQISELKDLLKLSIELTNPAAKRAIKQLTLKAAKAAKQKQYVD